MKIKTLLLLVIASYSSSTKAHPYNKEFLKIVGLSAAATCGYAVAHDQVTARLSPEYFNSNAVPHHKYLLDEIAENLRAEGYEKLAHFVQNDPTTIAFVWGIAASWWVALPMGVITAHSAQLGNLPTLSADELKIPLAVATGATALASMIAGYIGKKAWDDNDIKYPWFRDRINAFIDKEENKAWCYSNGYSHEAAYVAGAVSCLTLNAWIWWKRYQKSKEV